MKTCDIFCRVIDNYGDIGVSWRLARQLAKEYPLRVRLWVDELQALLHIWPRALPQPQQLLEHVDVRLWRTDFDAAIVPADLVIEAFACNLPPCYIAAMKRKATAPSWFNLEYLSAETWVEGCHGLASIHPEIGLKKIFFFPGITAKTGGLIKEAALVSERDQFLSDPGNACRFLQTLGVTQPQNSLIISLFSYENSAIDSLIRAWCDSPTQILCLVPEGKILANLNVYLGQTLALGDEFAQGSLCIKVLPFLIQTDYDRLLWSCDINFIRGEDSFVRAQWAAKPFIWHIYPQDEDIHMLKLNAFLHRYLNGSPPALQDSITRLWHDWNQGSDCTESWKACLLDLPNWQKHNQHWCQLLDSLGDLASKLVQRCP